MNRWALLAGAIVTEVTGTLALRGALDRPWLYAMTAIGYFASFFLLIKVLQAGMPLGVAYGVWSALGVAATAVLSSVLFDEAFTALMVLGLVLIVGGVVLVEAGSHPCRTPRSAPDGVGLPRRRDPHRGRRHARPPGGLGRPAPLVRRRGRGYVASFVLLSLALDAGLGIGVAYGIWTAVGVALTAVASRVLFDEPLTPVMSLGIALIAAGVVLLQLGANQR